MSEDTFLPRRLDRAFSHLAVPEAAKALMLYNNPAYVSFWDDHVGTRTGSWPAGTPYAATVGTGSEVIGLTAAVGGTMTLTTAAGGTDSAGQALGLNWNGDKGIYFICRFKIDDITLSKFEVGLTDSLADDGAVLNKTTTNTFTATDCAVFVRDTGDNTTTAFVTNGGTTDGDADAALAAVDGAYMIAEIVVQGDVAVGYLNGVNVGSGNIQGGNALTPWVYVEELTTDSEARVLTVDYWGIIGPR